MLTAVDHLVLGVAEVSQAVETYRNLGFTVTHGEDVGDSGHQAAYMVFGDFYVEFRAAEHPAQMLPGAMPGRSLAETLRVVFRSDNLEAEVARLKTGGFRVSNPVDDPIDRQGSSRSGPTAGVDSVLPAGFVEQTHAADRSTFAGGVIAHPNTASALERIYVAVESIDRELELFEQLLGVPAPEPEMGTVIMSMMSVFYVGDVGIAVAEPRGPGPTADALSANGPGLFQVLFRAEHLDTAAAVMVANGVPPPMGGTRLSGESALLIEPAHACNLFIALAGRP